MKNIKKFSFDKKYFKISACALAVIVLSMLFKRGLDNPRDMFFGPDSLPKRLADIFAIFIFGFFIAYFMNLPVKKFDKIYARIKKLSERPKLKLILSILTVYLIFGLAATLIGIFVLPEIARSFIDILKILDNIPSFLDSGSNKMHNNFFANVINYTNEQFGASFDLSEIALRAAVELMDRVRSLPSRLNEYYSSVIGIAKNIFNFAIGMIIAFYMLCEKDNIKKGLKKLFFSFFNKNSVERFLNFAASSNNLIERYTLGLILDSSIVGTIFSIISMVLGFPFPVVLGILVIIANLIPYFGPVFGGVSVFLIVFSQDPVQGIWAGIILLVLQQLDGNIMQPKVVGVSIGLKPLSVIFSIIAGGVLFGPIGMFLGNPIFAVISSAVKTFVNQRYEKRTAKLEIASSAENTYNKENGNEHT